MILIALLICLAEHGLLSNEQVCCKESMGFVRRPKYSDGRAWYCKRCKSFRSIRVNSFFADSRLTLSKILELMYWWSEINCQLSVVKDQVSIAWEGALNWYNYFRDICGMYCIDHLIKLGGNGTTVEIDESKFMHGKYHRGRWSEGHWVLGMIERGTMNCVLVPVEDRSAQTLLPIIAQYVLPNTRIITDGWRAYQGLANHQWVNHRYNFVDRNDPNVHINTVEGNWSVVKAKYRSMRGTSDVLWDTYLHEFCGRRAHQENTFMNLIYWIRYYYPL